MSYLKPLYNLYHWWWMVVDGGRWWWWMVVGGCGGWWREAAGGPRRPRKATEASSRAQILAWQRESSPPTPPGSLKLRLFEKGSQKLFCTCILAFWGSPGLFKPKHWFSFVKKKGTATLTRHALKWVKQAKNMKIYFVFDVSKIIFCVLIYPPSCLAIFRGVVFSHYEHEHLLPNTRTYCRTHTTLRRVRAQHMLSNTNTRCPTPTRTRTCRRPHHIFLHIYFYTQKIIYIYIYICIYIYKYLYLYTHMYIYVYM